MVKSKTKLELISHREPTRRATFHMRKANLLRELEEFTTLCGIIACVFVYDSTSNKMDVWPSPQAAFYLLILMLKRELEAVRKKNQALERKQLLIEYLKGKSVHGLSLERLSELGQTIDEELNAIEKRKEFLEGLEGGQVDAANGVSDDNQG